MRSGSFGPHARPSGLWRVPVITHVVQDGSARHRSDYGSLSTANCRHSGRSPFIASSYWLNPMHWRPGTGTALTSYALAGGENRAATLSRVIGFPIRSMGFAAMSIGLIIMFVLENASRQDLSRSLPAALVTSLRVWVRRQYKKWTCVEQCSEVFVWFSGRY